MIRIAATIIYNTACGPFGSGAWQNEISWAADELTRLGGPAHPLFMLHFDEIARECRARGTWGTQEHQEEVWRLVCESKPLWKQGAHVKYSRWFSFLQRSEDMLTTWHSLLLVLTWLGIEKKWWRTREEFPLWNPTDALDVYGSLGQASEPDGEEAGEVADSGLQELRRKTSNQLHMTARLLANPMLRSLVAVMCVVSRPVSTGHARMVAEFKSSAGSLAYWVYCASGAWEQDMRDILAALRDEGKLQEMGFKIGVAAQREGDVDEEELLRKKCVEFAFRLVGQRTLTRLSCSCSLPLKFAALLSDEERIRMDCLKELQLWWEVLKYWELLMVENRELRDLHASLLWPRQQWVRWVLGALEEHGFGCVPERVRIALMPCFEGVTNTEPVEDMFHYMRAEQKKSPNNQMSRAMRWWHAMQSPVLMEQRKQARAEEETVTATAPYLPKQLFSSAAGEPSVGREKLGIICGVQSWPSPGTEAFAQLPLLWLSAVEKYPNIETLCGAWKSSLLVPHSIVTGPARMGGLVMMSSAHGALLWRLVLRGSDKSSLLDWHCSGKPWSVAKVDDINEWFVMDFEVKGPDVDATPHWHNKPEGQFIYIRKSGNRKTLLEYSASHGFPQCTVPQLKCLHKYLQLPSGDSKLRTERDLLLALLPACLPSATEGTINHIMEKRLAHKRVTTQNKSGENSEDLPMDEVPFQEVLDEDDVQQLRNALQKRVREARISTVVVSEPAGGQPSASSGTLADPSVRRPRRPLPSVPDGEPTHSLEVWRSMCPQVLGCRLSIELKWHTRYRCEYPEPVKGSTSRSWGHQCSQNEAAMHCVSFLWHQHWRATGEICPWDIPDQSGTSAVR
eukprot:6154448-Amphidinium_carterae.1